MADGERDPAGWLQRFHRYSLEVFAQIRRLAVTDPWLVAATALLLTFAAAASLVIAKLLDSVMEGGGDTEVDVQVLDWVVQHRTTTLTPLARGVSHLADPAVVVVIVGVATISLVRSRRPRLGLFLVTCTLGTAVLTTAAKLTVDRVRPPRELWLSVASGPAFPSGHSAQAVACYGALAVVGCALLGRHSHRIGIIATALAVAVLVGGSRLYLGVHWLSDVIAGWAVASLWLFSLVLVGWAVPRLRRIHHSGHAS